MNLNYWTFNNMDNTFSNGMTNYEHVNEAMIMTAKRHKKFDSD